MVDKEKFSSYPEGYERALSLLDDMPEEKRDAFLQSVVNCLIGN